MASVEHANLSLFVVADIACEDDLDIVNALFDIFRNIALIFDRPETEGLSDRHQSVGLTDERLEVAFRLLVAGVTRYDAVDERIAPEVLFVEPALEFFGERPEGDVLVNAFFQLVCVIVDQLDGEEVNAVLSREESFVKEFRQLGGIGDVGKAVDPVARIVANARLRGVGNDELQLGICGKREVSVMILEGIDDTFERFHAADALHDGAVFASAEDGVIFVFLLFEQLHHAASVRRRGLDRVYAVICALKVQRVKIDVGKGAEKVAFAVLQYFDHGSVLSFIIHTVMHIQRILLIASHSRGRWQAEPDGEGFSRSERSSARICSFENFDSLPLTGEVAGGA